MEGQSILYETLSPLAAAPTSPTPTESSTGDHESDIVFRNLISLSCPQCASPESSMADYFSLEVNELEEYRENSGLTASLPPTPAEASTSAPERTPEGNWFNNSKFHFKSPMLRLHREILDFCTFLSPTPDEQGRRNAAVESVFDVVNYIWPNAKTEVFGSFKTGLCLPSSDIVVVILSSNESTPRTGLQALSRALSQRGIAKKCTHIFMTSVCDQRTLFLKLCDTLISSSGIDDVSLGNSFDAHSGPQAAEFIKDTVSKWPPLRPFCLILKVFLQQRELNEVYTGGIGSHALLSMLIAMLRNRHDQAFFDDNLGVLLRMMQQPYWMIDNVHYTTNIFGNFFDMYGRKLNTVDVVVSCDGRSTTFFPKSYKGFSVDSRASLISIEGPRLQQVPDNDVGKSSFKYFRSDLLLPWLTHSTRTNEKIISRLGPKKSILGAIIRRVD